MRSSKSISKINSIHQMALVYVRDFWKTEDGEQKGRSKTRTDCGGMKKWNGATHRGRVFLPTSAWLAFVVIVWAGDLVAPSICSDEGKAWILMVLYRMGGTHTHTCMGVCDPSVLGIIHWGEYIYRFLSGEIFPGVLISLLSGIWKISEVFYFILMIIPIKSQFLAYDLEINSELRVLHI